MERQKRGWGGWFFAAVLLVGCGASPEPEGKGQGISPSPVPAEVPLASACDLRFPGQGLCASVSWVSEPGAAQGSLARVRFWKEGDGPESEPAEPRGEVSSFLRMQCCGSVFPARVRQVSEGLYEVSELRFVPGDWAWFVQLAADGGEVEQAALEISL